MMELFVAEDLQLLIIDEILKCIKDVESYDSIFSLYSSLFSSDHDKKMIFDQCYRYILKEHMLDLLDQCYLEKFIDLLVLSVKKDVCTASTLFILLSDLFDMITLNGCTNLFLYLEKNVEVWKNEMFYNAGKNYLLRMCNDLLRRLSKSRNTVFCGQIQLFLAHLFPLEEKSGLNLMSNFNMENMISYNTNPELCEFENDDALQYLSYENKKKDDLTIDYNLYKKFWMIQDFFKNPTQCYGSGSWKTLTMSADDVFGCFKSFKLCQVKMLDNQRNQDFKQESCFAKYLTSDKLFNLQLSDSNFRRNILVQFLILFQYLTTHVKFKLSGHVLSEGQLSWITDSTKTIYELLLETPSDGELFAKTVKHILDREENWITWKNEGCISFIRKKLDQINILASTYTRNRKRNIGADLKLNTKIMKLGNPEMTKLWNLCPDNEMACKSQDRNYVADLNVFFGPAIEQLDPNAAIEDNYKLINNSTFAWKSLRLLASQSPSFFSQNHANATPIKNVPRYLEQVLNKLTKELPQPVISKSINDIDENVEDIKEDETLEDKKMLENNNNNECGLQDNEDEDQMIATNEHFQNFISDVRDKWKILATIVQLNENLIKSVEEQNLSNNESCLKIIEQWKVHTKSKILRKTLEEMKQKINKI